MITPMIVWIVIAVSVAVLVIGRFVASLYTAGKHHPFIEMGSEQAEFWIPGDPEIKDNDYDFEEYEDI